MYRKNQVPTTSLHVNTAYIGETIETKVERILSNKEPITDGAPIIYTERKDGVQPEYDVRTDRFDVAIDAMDKVTKTKQAQREKRHKKVDEQTAHDLNLNERKGNGGAEPIQGTESN